MPPLLNGHKCQSIGQNLQPLTGKDDVPKWVKNSWVEQKNTNKTNESFVSLLGHSRKCLTALRIKTCSALILHSFNFTIIHVSCGTCSLISRTFQQLFVSCIFYRLPSKVYTVSSLPHYCIGCAITKEQTNLELSNIYAKTIIKLYSRQQHSISLKLKEKGKNMISSK